MAVSERLLKIIERIGILVALTFDSGRNETQNATFEGSHLGKPQNFTYHFDPLNNVQKKTNT